MLYETWRAGLAVILPFDTAISIDGIHLQNNGWAPKRKKEKGRNVGNCSGVSARFGPQIPLNTSAVKLAATQRWGQIHHPTVEEIAQMCLKAEELYGRDNIVLWKMDLSGAYTLLFIMDSCVRLLAFEMQNKLVFFYIAGIFGWTGMPAAFEVVTRVLRVILSMAVSGWVLIYVDDVIACSHRNNWKQDLETASKKIKCLLGSKAEAEDKRESTDENQERSIVCLGWKVDLKEWTIDVAEDNRMRALYTFWTVDVDRALKIEEVEKLCSLAERYSKIYRELGVLMGGLYKMLSGHNRSERRCLKLSTEAISIIFLWRAYLLLSEFSKDNRARTGRPMYSFRVMEPSWVIEFDGSLIGVGYRVYKIVQEREVLIGFGSEVARFNLDQRSEFQNAMEMAAMVIAVIVAVHLGASGQGVRLRGDSVTVLEWASHESFKSKRSLGAAMLLVAVLEESNIVIVKEGQHISSEDNFICDRLSRGKAIEDASCPDSLRLKGEDGGKVYQALDLMNPLEETSSESSFIGRWRKSREVVKYPNL